MLFCPLECDRQFSKDAIGVKEDILRDTDKLHRIA